MNCKELRIGNYLGSIHELRIVDSIQDYCAYVNVPSNSHNGEPFIIKEVLKDSNPIPLTEEWLVKFGFSNKGGKEYQINTGDQSHLIIELYDYSFSVGYAYESSGTPHKIQYVHQLQNLYFALTGEELTIK